MLYFHKNHTVFMVILSGRNQHWKGDSSLTTGRVIEGQANDRNSHWIKDVRIFLGLRCYNLLFLAGFIGNQIDEEIRYKDRGRQKVKGVQDPIAISN